MLTSLGAMTYRGLVVLAGLSACADPTLVLLLPESSADWATEVLYAACPGGEPTIYARTRESEPLTQLTERCDAEMELVLLRFAETLEELELSAGVLPEVPCSSGSWDAEGCCLTRGLPTPAETFEVRLGEESPSFRARLDRAPELDAIRYRRSGLRFRLVGAERRVGVSSLSPVPWGSESFLLLEELSNSGRVLIREINLEDARASRSSSVPPITELEGFYRLSHAVPLGPDELLIASATRTLRGPPSGPFSAIGHEGEWISELLVERGVANPRVYGLSHKSGIASRLEGDRWQPFSPEVPSAQPCQHPAGRAGQDRTSIWHDGAGYFVPPSGIDHSVPYPNGLWRIEDDVIRWQEWPEPQHCVSALSEVRGALWAGTRDGLFLERRGGVFTFLDLPEVRDTVTRILPLSGELVLVAGDAGLLGVTDGSKTCLAPKLLTGAEPTFKHIHRVDHQLLVVTSEADHVQSVLVLEL